MIKPILFALVAGTTALPAFAAENREMNAHVHGVGTVQFAAEGTAIEVMLTAPGMDLVGFEYDAQSDADKAAVENALKLLADPANVFTLPKAAGCESTESDAQLSGEHSEEGENHDDHDSEHGHEEHSDHTEFSAHYTLTCANPEALTDMTFVFFETFPNAQEIELVYVTDQGAGSAEATRAAPVVSLR